jgi:hypothetical protein
LFSFAEKTMALMTPKMATSSQNMILRSKTKRLLQREVRDQILCAYTGGFDSASEDGSSGNENTPGDEFDFGMRDGLPRGTNDRETNIESYAKQTPRVWTRFYQKLAGRELFPCASKEHI